MSLILKLFIDVVSLISWCRLFQMVDAAWLKAREAIFVRIDGTTRQWYLWSSYIAFPSMPMVHLIRYAFIGRKGHLRHRLVYVTLRWPNPNTASVQLMMTSSQHVMTYWMVCKFNLLKYRPSPKKTWIEQIPLLILMKNRKSYWY